MSTPVSCPPGPVSFRGSFAIYFLPQMEIQPLTKEMFKNKQAQRYREQMGGCQRQGVGVGEMGEGGPKVPKLKKKKKRHVEENRQDIPGGPMVKTPCFLPPARTRSCSRNPTSQTSSAEGGHSVPGWGTKSLHAHGVAKKKKIVYKGKQADSPLTRG